MSDTCISSRVPLLCVLEPLFNGGKRIREDADDENRARFRKWPQVVPNKGKEREADGYCTNQQAQIHQAVRLDIVKLLLHHLKHKHIGKLFHIVKEFVLNTW